MNKKAIKCVKDVIVGRGSNLLSDLNNTHISHQQVRSGWVKVEQGPGEQQLKWKRLNALLQQLMKTVPSVGRNGSHSTHSEANRAAHSTFTAVIYSSCNTRSPTGIGIALALILWSGWGWVWCQVGDGDGGRAKLVPGQMVPLQAFWIVFVDVWVCVCVCVCVVKILVLCHVHAE